MRITFATGALSLRKLKSTRQAEVQKRNAARIADLERQIAERHKPRPATAEAPPTRPATPSIAAKQQTEATLEELSREFGEQLGTYFKHRGYSLDAARTARRPPVEVDGLDGWARKFRFTD